MKQNLMSNLRLVSRLYINGLTELLIPYNFTPLQWALLRYLVENGESTYSDVATKWQMENPTITPVAHNLVKRQLIEIQIGLDKRQKLMVVTSLGKEQYDKIQRTIYPYLEEVFEGIDEKQQLVLHEVFENMYKNMTRRG